VSAEFASSEEVARTRARPDGGPILLPDEIQLAASLSALLINAGWQASERAAEQEFALRPQEGLIDWFAHLICFGRSKGELAVAGMRRRRRRRRNGRARSILMGPIKRGLQVS